MGLKTFVLKLTSAIAVDGVVLKAGELVELVEAEAKSLLARGKAVLATIEDDLGLTSAEPVAPIVPAVTVPADAPKAGEGDADTAEPIAPAEVAQPATDDTAAPADKNAGK